MLFDSDDSESLDEAMSRVLAEFMSDHGFADFFELDQAIGKLINEDPKRFHELYADYSHRELTELEKRHRKS